MDTWEDIIKQIITEMREKKKNPDMNLILHEAESKHGLSYTSSKSVLGKMLKEKEICVGEEGSHFINDQSQDLKQYKSIGAGEFIIGRCFILWNHKC